MSAALALSVAFQPRLARAEPSPPPAAAPAKKAPVTNRLDILEFDVDGNTVLDEASVDKALAPFLGENRSVDDVDAARAALEAVYRQRGYKTVAVAIPRQSVRGGIVMLEVKEGRVELLTVRGSQWHSIDRVKALAPSLWEGEVPDFTRVQKDLLALNQEQDLRVTPSLRAGTAPGTIDVDLVVDDHLPVHGSAEYNNRHSQGTSDTRSVASVSYDNLWQAGHSASLSYQTAPQRPDDARVLFGSYLARFTSSPFTLLANGLQSDSNVATVGGTNVLGHGYLLGLRGIWPLDGPEGYYPSASIGMAYKHFKTVTTLGNGSFETPVRYWPVTASYSGFKRGLGQTSQIDLSLNFAVPQWGSDTPTIDLNRYRARRQMFWVRAGASQTRDTIFGTQLAVKLNGQITDQPLISNEQFSVGGADTVRGYLESEALGDYGFNASIEWRSPSVGDGWSFGMTLPPIEELRAFTFVDAARVALREAPPEQRAEFSPASVGAGLTLRALSHVNGSLVWGEPIRTESATHAWHGNVLFKLSIGF